MYPHEGERAHTIQRRKRGGIEDWRRRFAGDAPSVRVDAQHYFNELLLQRNFFVSSRFNRVLIFRS